MTGARGVRVHAWAFVAGTCALVVANWVTGGPWWSFWPIAVWALVFATHALMRKAGAVDEAWAEERTADLRSKSYDASHIDRIAADHEAGAAAREDK